MVGNKKKEKRDQDRMAFKRDEIKTRDAQDPILSCFLHLKVSNIHIAKHIYFY